MFLKRNYDPEILDDFSIQDERIDSALKELKIINSLLGGNRVSCKGIKILSNHSDALTILDVGSGGSDILITIKKKMKKLNIYGLDINQRACVYLKKQSPDIKVVCGDILNFPFEAPFDVIHASLFFHHFKEEEIKRIIISLLKLCNRGIIVNDLRRSIFAWIGIKILTLLFSRSKEVKYDGPLSVKRGFIKKEWIDILNNISPAGYAIKKRWAFRWLIVIYK